jgi:hypothetical protein
MSSWVNVKDTETIQTTNPLKPNSHVLGKVSFNISSAIIKYIISDDVRLKKLKLSRYTPQRRLGERRYGSYSFSTSALDGSEWSASRTGRALAPGKGPR